MARKVLLADDSVTAQNMGRRILTDAGYEVVTVNNGSAALKKIAEQKPDIIVLDVYMPGYGGLEVCQRLKETRETARIPVLLTVGKLEPFKAEEARRARADAYIVKPFEASELLTALTKLEDKIVPGPEPYKPGRFAKAIAAFEEPQSGEDFGDKETGWKDRLIIPSAGKADEPEAERTPIPVGLHRSVREEDFKPEEPKAFERPLPAGLPADITPEEISAITAAAAALSAAKPDKKTASDSSSENTEIASESGSNAEPTPVQGATTEVEAEARESGAVTAKESAPVTFASAPRVELPAEALPEVSNPLQTPIEGRSGDSHHSGLLSATEQQASAASADNELSASTEAIPQQVDSIAAPPEKHTDAEVLAALAMLGTPETDAVTSLGGNGAQPLGPHWIAEPVSLEMSEATLILEREMEETFAVTAAFEAGIARASALDASVQVAVSSAHSPIPPELQAAAEPLSSPSFQNLDSATRGEVTVLNIPVVAAEGEAAFAAAASAGSESAQASALAPAFTAISPSSGSEQAGGSPQLPEPWPRAEQCSGVNIVTEQGTPVVSEEVVESNIDNQAGKPQTATEADSTPPTPESAASDDPSAISSLVDNMLAELKPKLMEELTKKLAKGKKKS